MPSRFTPPARATVLALSACLALAPSSAAAQSPTSPSTASLEGPLGLLVMAHGGDAAWNQSVEEAVAPLRDRLPTALALGMADPTTLQAGIDSLEAAGVGTVAVIRLFLSGDSFLHATEYLFGERTDAPRIVFMGHHTMPGDQVEPLRVAAKVVIDRGGMAGSSAVDEILVDRARSAIDPDGAGLLLVAHGAGDDVENAGIEALMEQGANRLRDAGYDWVRVATLREDWPENREFAEQRIRFDVETMNRAGRKVAVLPYRLSGFGPYHTVLEGLDYTPTEGFVPHDSVTRWIESRLKLIVCGEAGTSADCDSN
jgi:sirohydrochlorin ferrochelatase